MNEQDVNKRIAQVFLKHNRQVHLEVGRTFYNGIIEDLLEEDNVIIFIDKKEGKKFILLEDITKLEEYDERSKKDNHIS